jgi:hypothetical protein
MSHDHCHKEEDCSHAKRTHCCSCHGDCCCHEGQKECSKDFAKHLLEMADEAWMEVLKDKIKEQILASSGAHLDRLAKLVAESNKSRWKQKMGSKKDCDDYRQRIADFFRE